MDIERSGPVPISHPGIILNTITLIFFALSLVAVGLRIWSIRLIPRSFHVHDYMICAALVPSIAFTISACLTTRYGIGYHMLEISPSNYAVLRKLYLSGASNWLVATSLVRLSVLFFYLDLFRVQRYFRYAVYATMGLVVAEIIGFSVTTLVICQPLSAIWTEDGAKHCGNTVGEEVAAAWIMIFTDLLVVVLPVRVVFQLKMPEHKRRRVMGIFAVGGLVCLVSLARLINTELVNQIDYPFGIVGPTILTGLETYIGFMNACLPTIQPAIARIQEVMCGPKARPVSTAGSEYLKWEAQLQSPRASRLPQDMEWEKKASVTVESVPVDDSSTSSLSQNNIRVTRDVIVEHHGHDEISMV